MRIIFMGSPEFSVGCLKSIMEAGHEIACVYSQPPRRAGRGKTLRPTPVHAFAETQGLEVRTPVSLKSADEQAAFAALNADIAVVVAYGLLLPQAILDAPRMGCLNIHASLLPRWRGAAPIQRAIMAGDTETGVQVMQMEAGLDTGPVMMTARTDIEPEDTAGELHDRLAALGAELIVKALAAVEDGKAVFTQQSEDGQTYASKLTNEETRIDWSQSAKHVCHQINGLSPVPGAWFELDTPKGPMRIKALGARIGRNDSSASQPGETLDDQLLVACGDGAVRLTRLQKAGKGPVDAQTFLRGLDVPVGTQLSALS
ncbi:MAG: methionyl-tRNA formyltransferase [Hirschia sp.]|nr:methionyl-tRNA formyltransferase [Hirschia sp.]MBF17326.1 methionyl-tRNA formyltransferase [Hirschia sp.]